MLDLSDMQSNVLNSTQTQRIFVTLSISVAKTDATVCVKKDTYYLLELNYTVYRCNILLRHFPVHVNGAHKTIPVCP